MLRMAQTSMFTTCTLMHKTNNANGLCGKCNLVVTYSLKVLGSIPNARRLPVVGVIERDAQLPIGSLRTCSYRFTASHSDQSFY